MVFIGYFEDQEVIDITVFAPRDDENKKFTESDEADWTVQEAEQIVHNFLPSDAQQVGTLIEDEGLIMVEGFSPTLEQQVSMAAYNYGDNTPKVTRLWYTRTIIGTQVDINSIS